MFGGQIQSYKILHYAPRTSRKILARLKDEAKVVEHQLVGGGKSYNMYTLGPIGASQINMPYEPDYWMRYSDTETIQRLMAVDLYIRMGDYLSADLKIIPAESPYLYRFIHGDKTYNIGVVWDNIMSFIEAYRWKSPEERVILICQSLNIVEKLANHLIEDTPIRVITREELKHDLIFYKLEHKKWVLDIPDKTVRIKPSQNTKIIREQKMLLP